MLIAMLMVSLSQLPPPADLLESAEIGDANQYVQLRPRGFFVGVGVDQKAGNTSVQGTWKMREPELMEVTPQSCKGPACKALKVPWTAKVTVAAARALLVDSKAPAPLFPSGSYYCHHLGCEPRIGVEILSNKANVRSLYAVEDHVIGKNVGRNSTVVWVGQRTDSETKTTRIELCGRNLERAKVAVETLKADVADAPWVGPVTVVEAPAENCLWDVRLYVKDDVEPPVKQKR